MDEPTDLNENQSMLRDRQNWKSYLSLWPRYVLEMIVIIFSISISFWLERMNERRIVQVAQFNLLQNMGADLSSDIKNLENLILVSKEMVNKSDSAILLADAVDDFNSKKRFMFLFGSILPRPNFVPRNSTFFGAESTLRLDDAGLNIRLVEYYQYCDIIKEKQDDEAARVLNIFQPYLYSNTSAKAWIQNDFESLPADGSSFIKFIKGNIFQNIIFARKQDRENLISLYEKGLALANGLHADINAIVKK